MVDQERIWDFVSAMSSTTKDGTTKMQASVANVDKDGTVWVMLPGSDRETPTEKPSTEVARGDTVTVEWRAGKLYIVGNTSNPSAGTSRVASVESAAQQAWAQAYSAKRAADNAQESAQAASEAAAEAKETAEGVEAIAQQAQEDASAASAAASAASTAAAAADTKATNAASAAAAAQTSADNAASAAATADQKATAASTAATQAQTDAAAAKDAAEQAVDDAAAASSAATAASQAAATADTKATNAATAAANAQTSADNAATAAATADDKAEAASTAASAAQTSADNAASAAATADQKATAASSAASQAQTDAAAAQTAASNAQTAASSAQTSAQQAVADAATAGRAASVAQAAAEAAQGDIDEMEEWFWHDTNGSHILGATSGYRNDITSTGMEIVETSSQDVVAEFGANGAVIGKQDETHAEIDYHSLQLIDKEGNAYFHVNDFVDASGKVEITRSYISDGTTYIYILAPEAKDTNYSVKVDGSEWSSVLDKYIHMVVFNRVPAAGSNIVITYETDMNDAKAFTFGTRGQGDVGALSVALGKDVVASEFLSYAEGEGAVASDIFTHAQGVGTIANTRSQTVIGEYNIADNSGRPYDYGSYAFIIGNGGGDSTRSNAFTVDWSGNTEAAGDITDGSGNVLSDKADTTDVYTKTQADALLADKADTTDLADYLPLAGGTLTGALDQDMPGIVRGTSPSSTQWTDRIALCDANGEVIGYLRTPFHPDGREGIQIETKRTVNGSEIYNGVQFYINASGTSTVDVSDPTAWRDALALGSLAQKDSLSDTDIPSLPASKISSGVLSKARGGTGTADFGTVQNTNGSTKSVANSTNTELANFTLAAGTWLVVAGFTFAANSTGRRVMSINTSSGAMSNARTQQLSLRATDGGRMDGEIVSILSPTASTTYYANCWQNSGGALDASVYVRAIRLA